MKLFFNPIKVLGKTLLVVGLTSALGGASLFAQVYTGTLANLVATGGSLTIGDKIFSGFSYTPVGLTSFDPAAISVTASAIGGVDYLTWSGTMALTSSSDASADLALKYVVTSTGSPIDMIDQSYTLGNAINGILTVDETVAKGNFGGTIVANSDLNINTPSQTQGPNLVINPALYALYVTKDIHLSVFPPVGAAGSVTITTIEQSFHQVPEPGTMLLGSLGGGLLLLLNSRRRVRRD